MSRILIKSAPKTLFIKLNNDKGNVSKQRINSKRRSDALNKVDVVNIG
jgi:hypothetical protein